MSEMALTADHLIVVGRGRLIADVAVHEFIRRHSRRVVLVRSPQAADLAELLAAPDVSIEAIEPGLIEIALPTPNRRTHNGRVTQTRVARSEWTKLRTLRSTRYSLLAALALTIGFAVIAALVVANQWSSMSAADKADFDPLGLSSLGIIAIGVLGVMIISGEYSTGMIRSTLAAVPKRLPVLWGKAAVFGLVTLALSIPAMLIAFFSAQAIIGGNSLNGVDIALSLSDPGVARSVIGGALYVTLVGLLGLGFGAILRNTAGGITALVGLLFVIPPLMNVLPSSWNDAISPYRDV